MKNPTKDPRYTVGKEFTGDFKDRTEQGFKRGQMFVARFCGDWIGSEPTENGAHLLCIFHQDERTTKILNIN